MKNKFLLFDPFNEEQKNLLPEEENSTGHSPLIWIVILSALIVTFLYVFRDRNLFITACGNQRQHSPLHLLKI